MEFSRVSCNPLFCQRYLPELSTTSVSLTWPRPVSACKSCSRVFACKMLEVPVCRKTHKLSPINRKSGKILPWLGGTQSRQPSHPPARSTSPGDGRESISPNDRSVVDKSVIRWWRRYIWRWPAIRDKNRPFWCVERTAGAARRPLRSGCSPH